MKGGEKMSDINDTLRDLRDYFSSQPYQQMMKNITEISNRLKSSLSEINLDAFDAITSSAIQSTNKLWSINSKTSESLEAVRYYLSNYDLTNNYAVQLKNQSIERVSNIIETAIPDEASEKQSLENFLKTHEHTIGFVLALISILLELYFGLFPPSNNQSESFEENNQTTVQYLEADLSLQKELSLSIQELTQLLKDQNYPIEDISSGVNEDKDPERQENNCNIDDDISDP